MSQKSIRLGEMKKADLFLFILTTGMIAFPLNALLGCAQSSEISGALATPEAVDTTCHHLAIADNSNNRVLIWNTFPTQNYQAPDLVLGQSSFTGSSTNGGAASTSILGFDGPRQAFSDGTRFFVGDMGNNRILIWDTIPTRNQTFPDIVLGQASMITSTNGSTATTFNDISNLTVAAGKLIASDYSNNRVLIWNSIPTANNTPPNLVLGQPDTTTVSAGTTNSIMSGPAGVASDGT
jgi:hypothetical protein